MRPQMTRDQADHDSFVTSVGEEYDIYDPIQEVREWEAEGFYHIFDYRRWVDAAELWDPEAARLCEDADITPEEVKQMGLEFEAKDDWVLSCEAAMPMDEMIRDATAGGDEPIAHAGWTVGSLMALKANGDDRQKEIESLKRTVDTLNATIAAMIEGNRITNERIDIAGERLDTVNQRLDLIR